MLSLKLMVAGVFRTTTASARVTAAKRVVGMKARDGEARLVPYTMLSCVPGAPQHCLMDCPCQVSLETSSLPYLDRPALIPAMRNAPSVQGLSS